MQGAWDKQDLPLISGGDMKERWKHYLIKDSPGTPLYVLQNNVHSSTVNKSIKLVWNLS